MIEYLYLGATQYPVSFSNAAFMRYEDHAGTSGFSDFINALAIGPDGIPDMTKVKIGFFAKMTYFACVAGGNIARVPFGLNMDEVAAAINMDNLPVIITHISNALPRADNSGEMKGTTPQQTEPTDGKT